jgi:hypothetical protein
MAPPPDPDTSLRRTLEQIEHCAKEALSVVEHEEDPRLAIEDLHQAQELIKYAIPELVRLKAPKPRPA